MNAATSVAAGAATLGVLLLRVTLVMGATCFVAASFRRASAAVRHGVWTTGFVLVLALPLLGPILPALEIPLPALRGASGDALQLPPAQLATGEVITVEPMTRPAYGQGAATGSEAAGRGSSAALPVASALLLLWGVGAAARALWLVAQLMRSRRLLHAAVPAPTSVIAAAESARARQRGARSPRVLLCPSVRSPVTFGHFGPVVLLPERAVDWPRDRLDAVLLHELAHVRRGDFRWMLLVEAASTLYWPVPLVWVGRRSVLQEQERASDDAVLAAGTPPIAYADHLLEIARGLRGESAQPATVVAMAREAGLTGRVRAILDSRASRVPLASRAGVVAVGVVLLVSAPIAALRAAEASAPAPAVEEISPTPAAPPGPAPTSAALPAAHLWIEAENGVLRGGAAGREDLEASEARYVALGGHGQTTAASVALSIHLPQAGRYHAWVRTRTDAGPAEGSLTFGGHTHRGTLHPRGAGAEGEWRWVRLTAPRAPAALPEGVHVLRVAAVTGSLAVDRLYLTSDSAAVPSDRGPRQEGFAAVHRWIDLVPGPLREPLSVEFEVPAAGRYLVWGRVLGAGGGANSLHFSVDGGPEMIWDAPRRQLGDTRGRWVWDPASSREGERGAVDPVVLELTAGSHTLSLRPREEGTGIGALLITNDLDFRPVGRPESTPPVRVWLEAEEAAPGDGLRVRGDAHAGGYIEATGRGGRRTEPGELSPAVMEFEVPAPGIYTLWGRALAPSGSENSFWLRVDGGRWLRWNGIPRGGEWRWSEVRGDDDGRDALQLALSAGRHRIEIARREGGVRLDRLLLTNDDFQARERVLAE